jgi:hypothetical protein
LVLAFLAFSGIFGPFWSFSGIFGHFWSFLGIFWHYLTFLALNATFGIEEILFLPVSRPSLKTTNAKVWYY